MLLGVLGRCDWHTVEEGGGEEVSTPDEVDEERKTCDLAQEDKFSRFHSACYLPPGYRWTVEICYPES